MCKLQRIALVDMEYIRGVIANEVVAKVDAFYRRRRPTMVARVAQSAPRLRVESLGPSYGEECSVRHVAFWRGCWDGR